jgi:hypothetical protein
MLDQISDMAFFALTVAQGAMIFGAVAVGSLLHIAVRRRWPQYGHFPKRDIGFVEVELTDVGDYQR